MRGLRTVDLRWAKMISNEMEKLGDKRGVSHFFLFRLTNKFLHKLMIKINDRMIFMSRVQKNKELRKRMQMLIYPIIAFTTAAIILITVIDYRINNTLGIGGIKVIGLQSQNNRIALNIFNENVVNINFEFAKRDMMRLKRRVYEYVDQFEGMTREVIKQY